MAEVFVLRHSYRRPDDDGDDDDDPEEKFIGIYSSEEAAKAASVVLAKQPGFSDYPEAFVIQPFELDATSWTQGFVTVRDDDS